MKPPPCCNGEVRARSGQGRLGRVMVGLGQVMVMVGLGQVKVRLGQGRRVVSTTVNATVTNKQACDYNPLLT